MRSRYGIYGIGTGLGSLFLLVAICDKNAKIEKQYKLEAKVLSTGNSSEDECFFRLETEKGKILRLSYNRNNIQCQKKELYTKGSIVDLIVNCRTAYNCNNMRESDMLDGDEVDMIRLQ